ncbi:MAG: LysR substrate-binding domain-containing protein [Solirubrobacteraceae bacterium]
MDGRLDLGLLRPPVRTPGIEVEVVRSEPLVAVLPEGHARTRNAAVRVADLAIAWRRGDRAPALLRALDVTRRHLLR